MNAAAHCLHFAFAGPADEAGLRELTRANPMRGEVSVGFTHEPDYFAGTGLAGATDRILLARDHGRMVATGRCTIRDCWLNGAVRRTAYLGELRLDARVQGRWDIVRGGYAFFAEAYARDPADFCFTSIIADNHRARRLLERGMRGMPRYEFIGDYVTVLVPSRAGPVADGYELTDATTVPAERLADFLNAAGQPRHLAAHWTPETLHQLAGQGLRPEDYVVLRRDGEIVACAGVWDQSPFRQVRIHGYTRRLAAVRPFHNLLAPLFDQPRLPPAGTQLKQALLTPFACQAGQPDLPPTLLQAARAVAALRQLDCVAVGGSPADPWLRAQRGRRYLSRLYRVDWPGLARGVAGLDARPCLPDIGLL